VHNSASDELMLADLNQSLGGGFTIWPEPAYDPIGMAWANGRRCMDTPDPGPDLTPPLLWADGTPLKRGPHTTRAWKAMVDAHGLPCTAGGRTVGNWPKADSE